jgi:hypothetical protein
MSDQPAVETSTVDTSEVKVAESTASNTKNRETHIKTGLQVCKENINKNLQNGQITMAS